MPAASARYGNPRNLRPLEHVRVLLLVAGIAAAVVYVGTDLFAVARYPGFSFNDQAVSELFAIGAPTSGLVVPLFSVSSILVIGFSAGVAASAFGSRALRLLALMLAASGLVGLALWNAFPMHMRGAERSSTDTMHLILATNPFVWITLAIGMIAFRGWFRSISLATAIMVVAFALYAFRFAPALDAGAPTPGLGLAERLAQYSYAAWQSLLALVLLGRRGAPGSAVRKTPYGRR